MKICLIPAVALLTACAPSNALVSNQGSSSVQRRQFFGILGGAAAIVVGADEANAAAATTGAANVFTGDYDDPNHPGCLRQVKVVGAPMRADGSRPPYAIVEVTGYDGKDGETTCTDRPTRSDLWKVQGKTMGKTQAVIDFSAKGGPANLSAKYEGDGIVFPDGNKWVKVPQGTNSRRPKDMSTLKSD
eukprot:CAMPEP_0183309564 /NCGR_PEP_ID=MMETSP0160_2-20130417/25415_1 /TAXON_ID=2839 ORGANISM="Odontella Sinensis, Strain Grunow 1884" /NCGR_SAMPLE_ID=MMETSP0160_2 /ASSEMBLY_ACC=CAM_ASM_000250 /LENGTH=187 /DNA_ID=CAMNT_0025473617 /DNA_START=61 /DNA_END=624 /DNA_ORIENTATION=-